MQVLFRQVTASTPTTTGTGTTGTGAGGTAGGVGGTTGGSAGTGGGSTGGNTSGNTTGNFLYKLTPLTRVSGTATPLARPTITGPSGDQNIARVPIRFNTVLGGNSYIVEFATTPTFSDKRVLNLRNGTTQPFFQSGTGLAASAVEFDLTSDNLFKNLAGRTRIFYRVGVRSLNDNPGPFKASAKGVPNGDSYIYSSGEPFFTKLDTPPGAP